MTDQLYTIIGRTGEGVLIVSDCAEDRDDCGEGCRGERDVYDNLIIG